MSPEGLGVKNVRLVLEYDGTSFCGWQRQRRVRTVEGDLAEAIQIIQDQEPEIIAAARTDSGVHALGQVANFTSVSAVEAGDFKGALNSRLAPDVRVLEAGEVPLAFNARYDARSRMYRYIVSWRPTALWRNYRWQVAWRLDVDPIAEAMRALIGEHDFSAFTCKDEDRSPRICLHEASVHKIEPDVIEMRFTANRFLRRMVRMLVGTLVEVGRGKMNPSVPCDILSSRDRQRAGPCAPPHGLYLIGVEY